MVVTSSSSLFKFLYHLVLAGVLIAIFFFLSGGRVIAQPVQGEINPTGITAEQLHKSYTEKEHRYRLTVTGDNLEENETNRRYATFSWSTNCGRFYEGGRGPNSRYFSDKNKTVVWGYEYPKEDCTEAQIQVKVTGFHKEIREEQTFITQKIFYPEISPKIETISVNEPKSSTCTIAKRISIFLGFGWERLRVLFGGKPDDPKSYQVPAANPCVRG